MNKAQKKLVAKVFMVVLLLSLLPIFSQWIFGHLHWFLGILFIVMVSFSALSKQKQDHLPSYSERHAKFNDILEENLWMKAYYFVYMVAVAIGFYYAFNSRFNILERLGFAGTLGLLTLPLILPIIIFKVRQMYIEAGKDI